MSCHQAFSDVDYWLAVWIGTVMAVVLLNHCRRYILLLVRHAYAFYWVGLRIRLARRA